ncbi:MAG TPA: DUF3842 family protein [Anaerolineae bacterium]|nr:DUF3842 family protein [Anaerolineae bacterium]
MKILVVDGAGGSIGQQIVTRLRESLPDKIEILALGTNAIAASNMMKAGANRGASGENAFRVTVPEADIIVGPISIMVPNSFMGELTPAMAEYLSLSKAKKVLLPMSQPHIDLVGTSNLPLPHLMDETIRLVKATISGNKTGQAKEVRESVRN